jgi:hypothetical protein
VAAALAAAAAAIVALAPVLAGPGELEASGWKPLFRGIEHQTLRRPDPQPLAAHAVRIDLQSPGIRFFVTPPNGEREKETDGLRTTTFLEEYGCQVAINASPFSPVGEEEGAPTDVLGLSVSEGDAYSGAHGKWGALLITKDNKARIAAPPFNTEDVYNAVGGFGLLLKDGKNVGGKGKRHPRTAVGVSKDGRCLYILVIDGRQAASHGATTAETAAILKDLGAHSGLNLDGGGSTTLVFEENDQPKVVNKPIHLHIPGMERVSANHLGVFADPLPAENAE